MNTRILKLPEVKAMTGLSRSTIYAYKKSGIFPETIKLGPRSVGWLEQDIMDWIKEKSPSFETTRDCESSTEKQKTKLSSSARNVF
ncbi:MAG: helix-turn-helix transcriptional regulator [Rhodomicrobiaceae bacterium]